MRIWNEPADFWIGVGLVAEAPVMLIHWLTPDNFCNASLNRFIECPPSIGVICGIGLMSYFAVAWVGHKLGLGRGKS